VIFPSYVMGNFTLAALASATALESFLHSKLRVCEAPAASPVKENVPRSETVTTNGPAGPAPVFSRRNQLVASGR
jgi:hypothetical protein